jgi:hypothetical protein
MRKLTKLAAAMAFSAACASASAAGFWLSPIYSYNSSADAGGFNGDVKTTSYGIQGGYDFFTLGYKSTDYEFDRNDWLDTLHLLFADIHYDGNFSQGFGYFLGLGGSFGWENDFSASDNYTVRPRAGLSFDFGNDFGAMLGLKANFNEADNRFAPIAAIKYRRLGDYGLSMVLGYPDTSLMYRFTQSIALEGSASFFNQDVYQLSDDNAFAPEGYFWEDSVNANLGVVLTPLDALTLRAGVDATFSRDLKVYNSDGDEITTINSDPSYGVYVNGSLNF